MELDIYFKNVGQGDTIFLHWDGGKKTGLIDCNLYRGNIRPIIQHIHLHEVQAFEFVLMTHPHSDHFSGFLKLFEYCEQNNIIIKKFLHTATFDPVYLREMLKQPMTKDLHFDVATSTVHRGKHKDMLWELFCRLDEQSAKRPDGFIKSVHTVGNDYEMALDGDIRMGFLAPFAYDELREYVNKGFDVNTEEMIEIRQKYENNPYANYLSSFIQIFSNNDNWQVLLCSDITAYTLKRIRSNDLEFAKVRDHNLKAIQIPHHGSLHNHYPEFWKELREMNSSKVVISVGNGYGHPHRSVIKFYKSITTAIHATNYVGGYKEFFEDKDEKKMDILESITGLPGLLSSGEGESEKCLSDTPCGEKHLKLLYGNGTVDCQVLNA